MTAVRTVSEELSRAIQLLAQAGIDTAQLDAEVIMSRVIGASRVHVISHTSQRLRHDEVSRFRECVMRRARREPLAYIIGEKEFWGLPFEVTPAVLVPRPETETLVEVAAACLRGRDGLGAEVGAGSGCVAVALAVESPDALVYATESSAEAAEIARRNAARHGLEMRVMVLDGDLLDPLPAELRGRLDAVVSNPPYIPTAQIDFLQPEIAHFETRIALDGGPDGMEYHRRILDAAREWLKPGGWACLEVGVGQAGHVADYACAGGYVETRVTDDLAGIPRVVSCR